MIHLIACPQRCWSYWVQPDLKFHMNSELTRGGLEVLFSHQHGNHMPECIWVHCESLTAQSNSVQPSDSTTYLDASIPLISSQRRIADFASWHSAHKTNTCFPFENIARYQINYYWFSELDKQLILWVKKGLLFSMCWFEWPDSNHAKNRHWGTTAVVLGERSDWRRRIQRRHLQPKACHSHVAEAEVRVDALPWARSGRVIMRWGRSNRQCKGRIHGFAFDLALSSPAVVVYWPLTSPLCGGDTCRVLTASWQTRFLNSWLDGGPPNKTHRSAHMLPKGVRAVCVYVTVYLPPVRLCHWTHLWCVCAVTCVFVCAHFPSTDEN